jgi:cytidylate kinase
MPVITISRQFGSGGDEVAARVCSILGYRYMDKWLLRQVAKEVGLSENEVVDFSEEQYKARSFLESLFGARNRIVATASTRTRTASGATEIVDARLDEEQCINLVRAAVQAAHERGNFVVVGRGSQVILQEKPDVLHVRIEAPMTLRMMNVQESENMSPAEARTLIGQRDVASAQYLERFFGVRWDDPLLYHLLINTGRCDIETAARTIASAAEHLVEHAQPEQTVVP